MYRYVALFIMPNLKSIEVAPLTREHHWKHEIVAVVYSHFAGPVVLIAFEI